MSKVVSPASQAASISANACSSVSPRPKNAGDEPIPPKFPQPRISREISIPVPPRRATITDAESSSSACSDSGGSAVDVHDQIVCGVIDRLQHRARLDVDEAADWYIHSLRRVAEVHRQRPGEHDERLLLEGVSVAPALRAGLVPPDIGAGVGEAGRVAQLGHVARRLAGLVGPRQPHEIPGTDRHATPPGQPRWCAATTVREPLGSCHDHNPFRRQCSAQALFLAPGRFCVPGRPRRLAGSRRGRPRDRGSAARGQRQPRRPLRDRRTGRGDPLPGARRRRSLPQLLGRRRDLRGQHDDPRSSRSPAPRRGTGARATRSS